MSTKMKIDTKQTIITLVIIVSIIVIGIISLFSSHATGPYTTAEAENGLLASGATSQTSSSASGGKYVNFNSNIVSGSDPVIVAAGDIACDPTDPAYSGTNLTACQERATAALITSINAVAVLPIGDEQYESGTIANFQASYAPTWGAFLTKTYPAIGNHEGGEGGSNTGYFDYFNGVGNQNGRAGSRTQAYYSYNVGTWHIIALNSNCGTYGFNGSSGGCTVGSAQETWLKADLAANKNFCTLAYWHVPRFSSGSAHFNDAALDTVYTPFWNDLYAANADVVLNGHDHDYERFNPLTPGGVVNNSTGIVEIIAGTGGKNNYSFKTPVPGSAIRGIGFGVLKLTLHPTSYDWKFDDAPGTTITDSGTRSCH